MANGQWFHDEEFTTPLPTVLADECARFYGTGPISVEFAQAFAAFLEVDQCREAMQAALNQWRPE